MPSRSRPLLDHPVVVGLLLLAFFGQAYRSSLIKSPVFDEPAHIAAGLSYFETGEFKVNLQHPPLLKEIGALPLWLLGVKWPMSRGEWVKLPERLDAGFQWRLGRDIIFENDPARVMFWSRLPFLLLATLLGYCLYAWGRGLLGGTAAVGALLLYALDPTILAHGQLVTTDVGFAAFTVLLFYALWRYLNHRTFGRLLLCGLALGAMLASKFSAVFLVPVVAILLLWAPRFIPAAVPRRASTLVDPYASEDGGQRIVWSLYAFGAMLVVAALLIHALYFLPGDPGIYLRGMLLVNADHDPSYLAFMAGGFGPRFLTYYLVAWLLKEPIPTIALVGLGLFVILRRGSVTTMDRAFLLLPPAVIFVSHSLWSHNLGIRYIIPALPFLYLAGGAGLASLIRETGPAKRVLAVALVAWLSVGSVAVAPDHLSYFNELACLLAEPSRIGLDGGTSCGTLWLDDSNVDWGQGVWQLKSWLEAREKGRPFRFAYFGSMRPDNYGLNYEWISLEDLMHPPSPGLYVLSAHYLARAEGQLRLKYLDGPENWLLHTPPTAVVGHAYYVYDIPPPAG